MEILIWPVLRIERPLCNALHNQGLSSWARFPDPEHFPVSNDHTVEHKLMSSRCFYSWVLSQYYVRSVSYYDYRMRRVLSYKRTKKIIISRFAARFLKFNRECKQNRSGQ